MPIKAKKSLGQNFLIDKNIIKKISSYLDIEGKSLLEVGPGTGNLTEGLLSQNPFNIIAVEKDKELSSKLNHRFKDKVKVINEDILDFDNYNDVKEKMIVFGNLPYNISTEILIRWILKLDKKIWFSDLILMFQKEVADRIIAQTNSSKYGRLSILSQWRFDINKIIDVNPNCFRPIPKISSSVLHFKLKENYYKFQKVRNLEIVTRTFFNERRKMIKKPMRLLFKNYEQISQELNLDLNKRPQNLDIITFFKITKMYEKLGG